MSRTIQTRRGSIHGVTATLAIGGFYTIRTKTGRGVAVSARTRHLLIARG